LTKNQPEKKDESRKGHENYDDYFASLLYEVNARQLPLITKLQGEYDDLGTYLKELEHAEDRVERNLILLQRRFTAQLIGDMYGYTAIVASLGLLGTAIDSLKSQLEKKGIITATIEDINKTAKAGIDQIDTAIAKRLAQLLDLKGHEGMYDTGTKPSGSN
jgi:hypothetical protein